MNTSSTQAVSGRIPGARPVARRRSLSARENADKVHHGIGQLMAAMIAGITGVAALFLPGGIALSALLVLAVWGLTINGMIHCRHTRLSAGRSAVEISLGTYVAALLGNLVAIGLTIMADGERSRQAALGQLQMAQAVQCIAALATLISSVLLIVFFKKLARSMKQDRLVSRANSIFWIGGVALVAPVTLLFTLPAPTGFFACIVTLVITVIAMSVQQLRLMIGLRSAIANVIDLRRVTEANA